MDYSNNSATVYNTVASVLPAGWQIIDSSGVTRRRTIPTADTTTDYNVTALKVLEDCVSVYGVRFRFNTANKTITIINPANYVSRGAFATRDLNLKNLNYKGKSDSFATRLYAEGKDGLTFASINDGKPYVENRTYADKTICAFWKDDRYTDKQSLLEDAQAKVDEMGVPAQSYDCDVLDLANTNPEIYGFEDFSLFEVVTLVDDAKLVRTDYQVVERWTYPYYPVNNKVVLSSSTPNIQSAISTVVNSIGSSTSTFQQMLQSAIANATALITGNSGGYLVLHDSDGDGTPDELLIMNTPDIATATNVWRWNQAGLGYSSNGYNGTYDIGITMDGSIVADFITAGTLNGDIIRAGTLQVSAFSDTAKSELDLLHNYLPYDIFSNLDRWEINAHAVTLGTYTVDGITYDCMFMDGTSISSYTASYQTQVKSDYMGKPTLEIKFNYIFKDDVTVAQQQFFYLYFKKTDGAYYTSYWNIAAGNYEKDTVYTFTATKTFTDEVDPSYIPRIGFRFIPNVETCITNFTVIGLMGDYQKSTLEFTVNGLNSVVQRGAVISSINQSAESISIDANKLNLTGDLNLRGEFTAYSSYDTNVRTELKDGRIKAYNTFNGQQFLLMDMYPAGVSERVYGNIDLYSSDGNETILRATYIDTPWVTTKKLSVDNGEANFYSDCTTTFYGPVYFHDPVQFTDDVYNISGTTVFVSDKRKKKNIKDLVIEKARSFVMALKPREFKFKKPISTSDRLHHGFIAQEVKEAMDGDWGVYCEDKEKDFIGIRYDELLADMVSVIQDQQKRIEELERRVDDLTNN
jgi:phage minor structural protein